MPGFELVSGDSISAGASSRAEIQTRHPSALIRITEYTTITLEQSDSAGVRCAGARLSRGNVWASVEKLKPAEKFSLTGPLTVRVLGPATFRMQLKEDGTAGVYVYLGVVEARRWVRASGGFDIHQVGRAQGLEVAPSGEYQYVAVPSNDPWRRGWMPADKQLEEE